MFVLTAYILSFILSFGEAKGTTRPINFLVMGLLAFVVLTAASNFTRMVVLYGGQQLQQLPPPKEPRSVSHYPVTKSSEFWTNVGNPPSQSPDDPDRYKLKSFDKVTRTEASGSYF